MKLNATKKIYVCGILNLLLHLKRMQDMNKQGYTGVLVGAERSKHICIVCCYLQPEQYLQNTP